MKTKIISLALVALASVGCTGEQGNAGSAGVGGPTTPGAHLTQGDIRVIAPEPAPSGQMPLYHKQGTDAVVLVTPMAAKGPAVVLIGAGEHDVSLMQTTCQSTVVVTLRNPTDPDVEPAVLNLAMSGSHAEMLPGSDLNERRVEIQMDPAAANNYGCNIVLRKKG